MTWFRRVERWLAGWPDSVLTLALLIAALVLVCLALTGRPLQKATALVYVMLP